MKWNCWTNSPLDYVGVSLVDRNGNSVEIKHDVDFTLIVNGNPVFKKLSCRECCHYLNQIGADLRHRAK